MIFQTARETIESLKSSITPEMRMTSIYTFPVLDASTCETLVETLESSELQQHWERAKTIGGDTSYRHNGSLGLSGIPRGNDHTLTFLHTTFETAYSLGFQALMEALRYRVEFKNESGEEVERTETPVIWNDHEGFQILRYRKGEYYRAHSDFTPGEANGRPRLFTGLLYLNEVEEGGETWFPNQNVTAKPEPGKLVIFPSIWSHIHEAREVKKGVKYACVRWAF